MSKSKQDIINDINAYIQKGGGGYRAWYVGISKNAHDRLFGSHNVRDGYDWWIYRQASSSQIAREIESYFVNSLGVDGGSGGGDVTADEVYAYKKAANTNP